MTFVKLGVWPFYLIRDEFSALVSNLWVRLCVYDRYFLCPQSPYLTKHLHEITRDLIQLISTYFGCLYCVGFGYVSPDFPMLYQNVLCKRAPGFNSSFRCVNAYMHYWDMERFIIVYDRLGLVGFYLSPTCICPFQDTHDLKHIVDQWI